MALHFASQMGRASCIPTLIGAGAVVNCSVKNGKVRETRLVSSFFPSSSVLPELYLHTWCFLAV
jgi:hypothetical protein